MAASNLMGLNQMLGLATSVSKALETQSKDEYVENPEGQLGQKACHAQDSCKSETDKTWGDVALAAKKLELAIIALLNE